MNFIRYWRHRRIVGAMDSEGNILEVTTDEPLGAQTRPPRASLPAADRGTTASASASFAAMSALDAYDAVPRDGRTFMDYVEALLARDGKVTKGEAMRRTAKQYPHLHHAWLKAQREAHWQTRRGKRAAE